MWRCCTFIFPDTLQAEFSTDLLDVSSWRRCRREGVELNGSCMGGHKLVVEPYPFHATHLDHKFAPTRDADNKQIHTISVDGYDTSLPLEYAKSMLSAIVHVRGIDALERLLQLRGCDRKGLENIKIYRVVRPKRRVKGFSFDPKLLETSPPRIRVPHEDPGLPKPPCLNNLLPPAWKGLVLNTETEEIPASSALPASTSRYAPEDPSLPKPWKCLVDNSTGYGYFWNTETNVTQYQRPPSETNAT
ncbi:unnamed protein product [Microthlaspi erraticum]|uniref:WW domain-containing protein n=1 Tax=Microthlaspi erraticum TaxID=1685480 RepID=A0A6D2KG18_9BRAS|nr:unnamed protein product [Microthlaspi erraticum]